MLETTTFICPSKCPDLSGRLIQPTSPSNPILMIVEGSPTEEEKKEGKFFAGKAGMELTNYLGRAGIPRDRCYLTSCVKCSTPGNRDPKISEIDNCSVILLEELLTVQPRFVVSVGRFATQYLLGPMNMEQVHGIPYRITSPINTVVIPAYHPAAGLHDTFNMSNIMADFIAVKNVMTGKIPIRDLSTHAIPPPYHLLEIGEDPTPYLTDLVAIDTETSDEDDTPWCLQFCCGGVGHIIMHTNPVSLALFANHVVNPAVTCVIHNSLFDLKVLDLMGVHPAHFTDTMIMAYLLQTEPQGLKPLVFRHLNVKMDNYEEVVGVRTQEMAIEYLVQVSAMDWPKLPPVLEMKAGKPKVRQPQTIAQKVNRLLKDIAEDKDIDVFARWHTASVEDGRGMVDEVLGPMRKAYLMDVTPEIAYQYAATDAWATYQLYPILQAKIEAMGLEEVLERDNGVVVMVEQMQRAGMPIDPTYFRKLRDQFTTEMDQVNIKIVAMVGDVHPGSDPQVLTLMESLGLLHAKRRWINGKEVIVRKKMVDAAALGLIEDQHPVVPLILRWRALSKLVDSFIDTLLEKKSDNNRIHTTLRVTRVVTGRLSSSSPNLMAIPTRTEDGRKIRGGFVAPDGYSFLAGDYSQVEMRIAAHLSQDKNMMHVFNTGQDIHTFTAAGMFEIPVEQIEEMKHRYPAKRVGFGILNLISAKKLLRELEIGGAEGWTEPRCQNMIDSWFRLYYGIAEYVEDRKAEARRTGMVRDWFGRVRLVPEVMSVHRQIVEAGIRQAVNGPIQMSAQGVIKEAMRQLVPIYQSYTNAELTPIIQIHDDLTWLVLNDLIPTIVPVIKMVMEGCVQISVPLKVDFKVGPRWEGMKKLTM